jgi:hypothetical protein
MPETEANLKRKRYKRSGQRFLWREDLHLHFVAAIFDSETTIFVLTSRWSH